ncbi:hypothetical protein ON010_g10943 [Phytophthora cinnamomi]|nr:hypothetical protein ON010_g10943 [Phytophthora cinnamomi]
MFSICVIAGVQHRLKLCIRKLAGLLLVGRTSALSLLHLRRRSARPRLTSSARPRSSHLASQHGRPVPQRALAARQQQRRVRRALQQARVGDQQGHLDLQPAHAQHRAEDVAVRHAAGLARQPHADHGAHGEGQQARGQDQPPPAGAGQGRQGAGGRARKTQVAKLSTDYRNQLRSFEETCQKLLAAERAAVSNLRQSSLSFRSDDDDKPAGFDGYNEDQIYAQANVTSYNEDGAFHC